jgi:hypothetical protein
MSQITNWLDADEIAAAQDAIIVSLEIEAGLREDGDSEKIQNLLSAWNALERIGCEITGDSPRAITGETLPT